MVTDDRLEINRFSKAKDGVTYVFIVSGRYDTDNTLWNLIVRKTFPTNEYSEEIIKLTDYFLYRGLDRYYRNWLYQIGKEEL